MKVQTDGAVSWLTPDWPAPANVRTLSTLRGGGVSRSPYDSLNLGSHVEDAAEAVAENRRMLRAVAGLPAEPEWLRQVHGTCVLDLDLDDEPTATGRAAPTVTPAAGALGGATGPGGAAGAAGTGTPRAGGCAWIAGEARGAAGGAGSMGGASSGGGAGRGGEVTSAAGPADAAITRRPGRVCAILTADCLPVLLASESGDRVGAAHAGWRGLAAGVLEATVRALGRPPGELLAWLGPAIGPRHFEVGAEVRAAFLRGPVGGGGAVGSWNAAAGGGWVGGGAVAAAIDAAFVRNSRGRYLADLYALARLRLAFAGVKRVHGGGECTYSQRDAYFSHRRDGRTGRQATLIWLERWPGR